MKTFVSLFAGAAAATMLVAAAPALAADGPSPEAVENATTAADHNAIADAYEAQAEDARARAQAHESMGTRYSKGAVYGKSPKKWRGPMASHCKRLTQSYNQVAEQYGEMAKAHREIAAQGGQ